VWGWVGGEGGVGWSGAGGLVGTVCVWGGGEEERAGGKGIRLGCISMAQPDPLTSVSAASERVEEGTARACRVPQLYDAPPKS